MASPSVLQGVLFIAWEEETFEVTFSPLGLSSRWGVVSSISYRVGPVAATAKKLSCHRLSFHVGADSPTHNWGRDDVGASACFSLVLGPRGYFDMTCLTEGVAISAHSASSKSLLVSSTVPTSPKLLSARGRARTLPLTSCICCLEAMDPSGMPCQKHEVRPFFSLTR